MNADIIKAIADILATIEACHEKADDGYVQTADPEWQKMADAGDALSVALGIGADTTWRETADAFRALARPDVGLPEGWRVGKVDGHPGFAVLGPRSDHVMVRDGHVWAREADETTYVPIAVYLHLLRAAGVVS